MIAAAQPRAQHRGVECRPAVDVVCGAAVGIAVVLIDDVEHRQVWGDAEGLWLHFQAARHGQARQHPRHRAAADLVRLDKHDPHLVVAGQMVSALRLLVRHRRVVEVAARDGLKPAEQPRAGRVVVDTGTDILAAGSAVRRLADGRDPVDERLVVVALLAVVDALRERVVRRLLELLVAVLLVRGHVVRFQPVVGCCRSGMSDGTKNTSRSIKSWSGQERWHQP